MTWDSEHRSSSLWKSPLARPKLGQLKKTCRKGDAAAHESADAFGPDRGSKKCTYKSYHTAGKMPWCDQDSPWSIAHDGMVLHNRSVLWSRGHPTNCSTDLLLDASVQ